MKHKYYYVLIAAIIAVLAGGCATSKTGELKADELARVKKSGFLGDYSDLKPGKDPMAPLLEWWNPSLDVKKYDKFIIDPVTVWGETDTQKDQQKDVQRLANKMHAALVEAFSQRYRVVTAAGPDVLHLRVGIVDAQASTPVLKAITTVVPVGIAASAVGESATGKPAFAGDITMQFVLKDSQSGEVVVKGIDERVGGRSLKTISDSWASADAAIEAWTTRAVYRFCKARGDTRCPTPKSSYYQPHGNQYVVVNVD